VARGGGSGGNGGSSGSRRRGARIRRRRRSVGEGARLQWRKGEAAARGCGGGEAAALRREEMERDRKEET